MISAGKKFVTAAISVLLWAESSRAGAILREVYTDIADVSVQSLTNSAKYLAGTPDATNWVTDLFEAPLNYGDNFGQRMHGYVRPPQSGSYTFWIASDDHSELWLSTNAWPATNLVRIASVSDWTSPREWTKFSAQQSAPIALEADKMYYISALMKEGTGGDNLAVRWQLPDSTIEGPIPCTRLLPPGGPWAAPQVAEQPADLEVVEGEPAVFSVSASNLYPVTYQWLRGGTNIAAATASNYVISAVSLADAGAQFSCVLSNGLGVVTSDVATLTVLADTNRPSLSSVYNVATTTLYVVFSEVVQAAGASNTTNYQLSGGISILAAVLDADARTTILTVSPLTYSNVYTLTVSNILDRASVPNAILSGSQWVFTAREYALQNIGSPSFTGTVSYVASGVDLTAGGHGLEGPGDAFALNYRLHTGDFDVQVRMESLDPVDPWAMGGIMARETLDADSPFAAVAATPTISGVSLQYRRPVGVDLLVNGDFESGLEGWGYPAGWGAWGAASAQTNKALNEGGAGKPAPSNANDGIWMMRVTNNRTTTGDNWAGDGQWVAVTPGERYVFSAHYLIQSNLPAGHSTYVNMEWYNGSKTEVSYESRVYSGKLSTQSSWTHIAVTGSAPVGAVYCKPVIAYEDLDGRTNSIGEQYNTYWDTAAMQFGAGGAVESAGSFPVNYPYLWLRLKRVGNLFTAFASHDGARWSVVAQVSNALPSAVYLGLYATSHDDDEVVTAAFRDWGTVTGGTTGSLQVTGFEPLGPSSRKTALAISEIMYNPAPRTDGRNLEFIELFNSDPIDADIGGYRIAGEATYTMPAGTIIPGGGFLVVARVPADVEAVYGVSGVLGPYSKNLPNSSAIVQLRNELGALLLETEYDDEEPWPVAADGAGPSLVLARASYGEGNAKAWSASRFVGGSPGALDPVFFTPYDALRINEIVSHTDSPLYDYIELYNHSTSALDLAGCILTDNADTNKYVAPGGTMIGARGFRVFRTNELGFSLSQYGETVYFKSPGGTSVVDAVLFEGSENGASMGRYPDGAPGFHELAARSAGTNNTLTTLRIRDIVINEIMYHPISESDDDEYIELYNRGSSNVNVGGWAFTKGVDYTFPPDTIVAPGAYIVVAKNATNLIARYPQLATTNTYGDYSGKLANSGERVVLAKLDDPEDPNGEAWVTIDEVTYGEGGDWGRWTDGDGCSLELMDCRSDNRLPDNWAGSIETNKGAWTTISATGRVDNGLGSPDELHVLMLNGGECLVDNVVVQQGGNRVTNGTFNTNIGGWLAQGHHKRSAWNPNGVSGGCLYVRGDNDGDTGVNRIESDLSSVLTINQDVVITAQVRWLAGHPGILFRIRGNYMEASGRMEVPANLGTPGMVNSRAKANTGPAIWDVVQSPILPAASEGVLVSARISDTDTVASVTLRYRVDPALTTNVLNMTDNGTGGDAVAGDRIYSAMLPGQSAGTLIAYHIRAVDGRAVAATNFYPLDAPVREALVRFGEESLVGNFGTYRLWMTQTNMNLWTQREPLDNDSLPCTFVYGAHRVIHNAGAYYRGSPFIRATYNTPVGNLCAYHVDLPDEDRFLGTDKLNLDSLEPARENTSQREKICFWMAGRIGVPYSHQRFVHVYVNGARRGNIYGDSLHVSADYVECWFPEEASGEIYKVDDWFEFPVDGSFTDFVLYDATLQEFTTTGGALKKARYRWVWEKKSNKTLNDDYSQLLELIEAMNEADPADYVAKVNTLVDVEGWAGIFALRHAVCDWDGYGYSRGKNAYVYKPYAGRWRMLPWDLDFSLGNSSSHPVDTDIFREINDPVISNKFLGTAEFRRAYLLAIKRIAEDAMWGGNVDPVCDANYAALTANGVSAYPPQDLKNWISLRRTYILSQVGAYESPFAVSNNGGADFSTNRNAVVLQGTAPLAVQGLLINGVTYAPSWTSVSNWSVTVVLASGSNTLQVVGLDADGNPVAGASDSIGVVFTGPDESPFGNLVINEIMYNPTNDGAEFLEIHNLSTNFAFDLHGMRVAGVDLDFEGSAVIGPGGFLVIAQDRVIFGSTYGLEIPVAAEYPGSLDGAGETLRLVRMNGTNEDLVADQVLYDDDAPWPAAADGGGPSLQLIDPTRDNDRVGNWDVSMVTPCTPGAPNTTADSLPPFPAFRINELMSANAGVLADWTGDFDPWVELHNGRPNVIAVELHQAGPNDPDAWLNIELAATGSVTLVPAGSVWKYLDDGSNQGAAWRSNEFNDVSWNAGPAQLGYGEGDEATTNSYGPDPDNKYVTTYYRHSFVVDPELSCDELWVSVLADDGAVVYLNGSEVFRSTNLPPGEITYQTFTLSYLDGPAENQFTQDAVSPALLRAGTNVLAVEVHQCNESSSDVSFDLALGGRFAMNCISTGATWRYLDDGSNQGVEWRSGGFEDNLWSAGAGPFGHGRGGVGTVISSNPVTVYLRKTFEMPGEWLGGNLVLRMQRDDAAAVYVNGSEILRDNLPGGALAWTTRASSVVSGGAETAVVEVVLSPGVFSYNETNLFPYHLSDTYTNLVRWAFPTSAVLVSEDFRLVWADAQTNESTAAEYHANFRLSVTGGCVALVHSNAGRRIVLDYVNYPAVPTNNSYGLFPDGVPWTWRILSYPSPDSENEEGSDGVLVRINEWMADNDSIIADPYGDYDDWVELFNFGTNAVALTDYGLTDNLGSPAKWRFPTGAVIQAGGFLLVWADSEPAETNGLHASWSLSKGGEAIGLFKPDGQLVDSVVFPAQQTDISEGRWPDASPNVYTMAIPTPLASNIVRTNNAVPVLTPIGNKQVNEHALLSFMVVATDTDTPPQTLTFSLDPGAPTGASIHAQTGAFAWMPGEEDGPATNAVTIRVTDNGYPNLSASEQILIEVLEVNQAPVMTPPGSVTMGPGSLLVFPVTASDADIPTNRLFFELVPPAPAAAEVDETTGVFAWAPHEGYAWSTNEILIRVRDDGSPVLSATGVLTVVVAGPDEVFEADLLPLGSSSNFVVRWNAESGTTYRVERASDLPWPAWEALPGDVLATGTVAHKEDTDTNGPIRFFRVWRLLE